MKVLFEVTGIVVRGKGEGRALGFPTANVPCARAFPSGIYRGEVLWGKTMYPAAIYKEENKEVIEAHLLDFTADIYGETLTIAAHEKIRDAAAFRTRDELIAAIQKDIAYIRNCKVCAKVKPFCKTKV
ncbi:MAG: riboflavin kinase [Candidatus Liptonbacteria bacterium]|nr:riboflavin kinase [Candidatus Liptonbacteria bacterium]